MRPLSPKNAWFYLALISVFFFVFFHNFSSKNPPMTNPDVAVSQVAYAQLNPGEMLENERNTIQIFKNASPFVVFVHRLNKQVDFFSLNAQTVETGSGSGFIWDAQGHVVTNYHVVAGADEVTISLGSKGQSSRAKIIGSEPRKDIAVLKIIDDKVLPPINGDTAIPLADSSQLIVGQKTIAIGNPFGLDRSLSEGVISALGRQLPGVGGVTIRNMVQTDASINPGNSGGPLIDSRGRLIGMNTVIFSQSGASAGVGFAVPTNTIKRAVSQIIQHGRVIMPGIGAALMDDGYARQMGIAGVILAEVRDGTPAARAGFKGTRRGDSGWILGDVIVAIDGNPVASYDDLYNVLDGKLPGQEVEITAKRDQKELKRKIKLVDINML